MNLQASSSLDNSGEDKILKNRERELFSAILPRELIPRKSRPWHIEREENDPLRLSKVNLLSPFWTERM